MAFYIILKYFYLFFENLYNAFDHIFSSFKSSQTRSSPKSLPIQCHVISSYLFLNKQTNKNHEVQVLLADYSWVWGSPWSMGDASCHRTDFLLSSTIMCSLVRGRISPCQGFVWPELVQFFWCHSVCIFLAIMSGKVSLETSTTCSTNNLPHRSLSLPHCPHRSLSLLGSYDVDIPFKAEHAKVTSSLYSYGFLC